MISLSDVNINATAAVHGGKVLLEELNELDRDLQIGLGLGITWLLLVSLGDTRLAALMAKDKKKAKLLPHTASTSMIIPISSLAFAAWLEYAFVARVMADCIFGRGRNVALFLLSWFGLALCVTLIGFGYFWRAPFQGLTINVREPRRKGKFGAMDYTCYKNDLGWSVFWQIFVFQLSTIVIPMELFIHQILGGDEDRAQVDAEDNVVCEGMMAQEMNHGKCQVLYSRAAEIELNYPVGYRRLWKALYFDTLPAGLVQAFVGIIEAGFIAITVTFSACPSLYGYLFSEPRWVFKWHLTEESEHCWDSVQDILDRVNWLWRAIMWIAAVPLLFLLFLPLAFIEGLAYGWRSLLNPLVLVTSILTFVLFTPNFVMIMCSCTFLHTVCGMRPSDKTYYFCEQRMQDHVFTSVEKEFKITHIQKPQEHLQMRRDSMDRRASLAASKQGSALTNIERNSSVFGSLSSTLRRRSSMTTRSVTSSIASGNNKRQSVAKINSIKRLSTYRASLYEETQQELRAAGMSQEEIDAAGFGSSLVHNMELPEEARSHVFTSSQMSMLDDLYEENEGGAIDDDKKGK